MSDVAKRFYLVWLQPSLQRNKNADVMEYPEVLDHIGLLVDGPPGLAGLPST